MTEKYEDIEKPTEDILYSLHVANAYLQIILLLRNEFLTV